MDSKHKAQSNKSKAKKALRKEEREKNDRHWKLVEEANKLSDPLASFVSFQKFEKDGMKFDLRCIKYDDLIKDVFQWTFDLTKANMLEMYEASWGWSDKEKMKEMCDDRMWYLIAFDLDRPVAFCSFRFDLDFGEPVVYCYEIQLAKSVQNKGLGTFMMQILQLVAMKNGMHKVVATVLDCNEQSRKFFMEKLRYTVDDTNLSDECYTIVSKPVKK
ncbi:N-alpha-acetyltransferase 40-like isoform X2 [Clavelina lepadiformis]|uniref:N-alpha-acetyltransferase 40-like isoform X1 n=1 Tax=Clavelina lepadiformis TaxID=159417 RepID=UPI0040423176